MHLANAFDNLQVLILKGAALTSLAGMQGARALLYLDLSNNGLATLEEVLRFLRGCECLVCADLEGNPCAAESDAQG